MKKLLLICTFIASINAFGQNSKGHNVPPGGIVSSKAEFKNYSSKLNNTPDYTKVNEVNNELFKDMTESNMSEMKSLDPEKYKYYSEALIYFKSLSDKVKAIYTATELWDIYQFDQDLKEKLKTIK